MKKEKLEMREMAIFDLKPAPYNPRVDLKPGMPEYEKLKISIETFGLVEPVVYNEKTGNVVGGHQRLTVLADLGYEIIPVSVVNLTLAKEQALNLALNKISGEWDNLKLKELLIDLGAEDQTLSGFDTDEIEDIINGYLTEDDDSEPHDDDFDVDDALAKEPLSRFGDVWQLGDHRLLVGDSTKEDTLFRLMEGEEADMVFTDPPYNVDYEGGTTEKMKIENDNLTDADFYQFLYDSFLAAVKVTKKGGGIYICHADSEGLNFRAAMRDSGWLVKQCLIWVKNSLVLGRQDYQWKHEPILYGWKPGAAHKWYGGRKNTTVVEDDAGVTVANHGDHQIVSFFNGERNVAFKATNLELISNDGEENSSIVRFDKPKRNGDHPTMKPITLCAHGIMNSSKPGDKVLDMFGGSGSTLIACEQTGRHCRIIEFEPKYADVVIRRWETYTGQTANKLS